MAVRGSSGKVYIAKGEKIRTTRSLFKGNRVEL